MPEVRSPGLKVRTPAFQAGGIGFKVSALLRSVLSVVHWTTAPHGWVCPVARAADCKSVTKKHRRFESCPIHFPFACPSGLWCHPAKVVCGNAPKVRILPQTL